MTDPAGGVAVMSYDANDHVVTVSDPRLLNTYYSYDGWGELSQWTSPDAGTSSIMYDAAGNVSQVTDGRGAQRFYSYDALNRVTQMTAQNGGVVDQTETFGYDTGTNGKGHLVSAGDEHQSLAWTYDALGRVVGKTQAIGSVTLSTGYNYINADLTTETTPSGQTITYTYNTNHQVAGIAVNGSAVIAGVTSEPSGSVTGWAWGNGTTTSRTYNQDGWLIQWSSAGASSYTYNDDGTIASKSDSQPGSYGVNAGTAASTVSAGSNQISSTAGTLVRTYAYDGAGNTTSDGSANFAYNDSNRLSSISRGTSSVSFRLNALGQRVSKTSSSGTTLFSYDETGHLVGEYSGSGALVQETVWLGDIPVATLRPDLNGGIDIYYVHSDHLNAPRRISRPSDNAIVWQWTSDPFGNGFVDTNPDGDGQKFTYNLRFPGQYHDAETGLNYNYFRDYDSATGRYVESDPMGLRGGSYSTYSYAGDNPVKYFDPRGLDYGFGNDSSEAGGFGHTTLYYQDGQGGWHSYNEGAAASPPFGGNLWFLLGLPVTAGVEILPIQSPPSGAKVYPSTPIEDARIAMCATKSARMFNSHLHPYDLYVNSCTGAAVGVLGCAGISVPNPTFTLKPNTWFQQLPNPNDWGVSNPQSWD